MAISTSCNFCLRQSIIFFDQKTPKDSKDTTDLLGSAALVEIDSELPFFQINNKKIHRSVHYEQVGYTRGIAEFDNSFTAVGDARFISHVLSQQVIDSLAWARELVEEVHAIRKYVVINCAVNIPPTMLLPFFDLSAEIASALLAANQGIPPQAV